jgi:membrane protein YdbS with pleckstrin-like domain
MVEGSTRGRPTSWIAVALVILGFIIAGLGLIFDGLGVVWWIGVGVAVAGGVFGAVTGIMEDVH